MSLGAKRLVAKLGIVMVVVSGATMPFDHVSLGHLAFMVIGLIFFTLPFMHNDGGYYGK